MSAAAASSPPPDSPRSVGRPSAGSRDAHRLLGGPNWRERASSWPIQRVGARENGVVSPLDEIVPGLWRFTVTRNGLPPTMTAYALRDGEDTILIDPIVAGGT